MSDHRDPPSSANTGSAMSMPWSRMHSANSSICSLHLRLLARGRARCRCARSPSGGRTPPGPPANVVLGRRGVDRDRDRPGAAVRRRRRRVRQVDAVVAHALGELLASPPRGRRTRLGRSSVGRVGPVRRRRPVGPSGAEPWRPSVAGRPSPVARGRAARAERERRRRRAGGDGAATVAVGRVAGPHGRSAVVRHASTIGTDLRAG